MNDKNKHDEKTMKLKRNPRILGLDKIVLSTNEVNIFKSNQIVSQPDNLMFDPSTGILYNIEYKCRDGNRQYKKAVSQLRKSKNFLSEIFKNYKIINLYVYEDYGKEVIK